MTDNAARSGGGDRSIADSPDFDSMVVGSLVRRGQSLPHEIAGELSRLYGPVSHQAVTAALGREAGHGTTRRHPNGCWSVRPLDLFVEEK